MGLPIIAWIAVAAVGAFIAYRNWDDIKKMWADESIAIFGPPAVGKTMMANFLSTGEVPEDPKQTLKSKKYKGMKLAELGLKINSIFDNGGATDLYKEWKKDFNESNIIFYLFRADLILSKNQDHIKRILRDFKHIGEWTNESPKKIFMIGTFTDKIEESSSDDASKYTKALKDSDAIKRVISHVGGTDNVKIHSGSLKSDEETMSLVRAILEDLT